jgi:hypothetical protein
MEDQAPATTDTAPVVGTTAPVAETVEQPKSWVNEDGSWNRERFGEDLGKHSIFDKYKTAEELAKAAINKDHLIGKKVEDWVMSDDPAIVARRRELMGVPKDSSGYSIEYPDTFKELPEDSQGAIKDYFADSAKWAAENGIPKSTFEAFVSRDLTRAIEVQKNSMDADKQAFEAEQAALSKKWGNSFENNIQKAENIAKMLEMEDLIPVLKANPHLMEKFFEGASKFVADDKIIESRQRESIATAQDLLNELDDRMMAMRAGTPEYEKLVNEKLSIISRMK